MSFGHRTGDDPKLPTHSTTSFSAESAAPSSSRANLPPSSPSKPSSSDNDFLAGLSGGRRQSTASTSSFHGQLAAASRGAGAGLKTVIDEDVSPTSSHVPSFRTSPYPQLDAPPELLPSPRDLSPPTHRLSPTSDEDTSPKSAASPSFQSPGHAAAMDHITHVIGEEEEEEGDPRSPSAPPPASLTIPSRPPFASANSAAPLLANTSATNTPVSPTRRDPFLDVGIPSNNPSASSLHEISPVSATSTSTSGEYHATPKIHINSLPTSPQSPGTTTSTMPTPLAVPNSSSTTTSAAIPSFTSPFSRRQSSLANIRNSARPYKENHTSPTGSLSSASGQGMSQAAHRASAASGGAESNKASIAERRSQRMRPVSGGRSKDRRSGLRGEKGGAGGIGGGKIHAAMNRKPFESTRLKGEIYKPWLDQKDPAARWARWITITCIIIGFAVAGVICYDGYASVPHLGKICSVIDDDFSSGTIDPSVWQHEVRLDGYNHGRFDWTTAAAENSFVKDGVLYIVPTLTSDVIGADAVSNGYTLNLTTDGTCTSTNVSQCAAVSNSSQLTVINPVRSARLITKTTASIRYGKVEVRAKYPTGDWLWPSISMLPVNETYGAWPRSGQINILTGRGNNASYPNRGVDFAQSDLHWGPNTDLDRQYLTWGYREQRRTYYNQKWHTYGLEWNDKFMWTYIDSKVSQVFSLRFSKESFWTRGKFPNTVTNTTTGDVTKLTNTWITSNANVAPFDQAFYLIIDLGVGATDGWFPDGEGGKPWLDQGGTAMSDFWNAHEKWYTNWPTDTTKRGFAIDSVKMWKTC